MDLKFFNVFAVNFTSTNFNLFAGDIIGTALPLDNAIQEIQHLEPDNFETMSALITPLGSKILSALNSGDEADNELDGKTSTDDDTSIGNGGWFDPNPNSFSWSDASSDKSFVKLEERKVEISEGELQEDEEGWLAFQQKSKLEIEDFFQN